jgi:hypothetical protein
VTKMNWLKENIACVGKFLGVIALFFGVIAAVLTFDAKYEKTGTARAEAQAVEQKVVKTLEQHEQREEQRNLQQRERFLTDQLMNQKQIMKKYPNDPEAKEDYVIIKEERDKVRKELELRR